MAIRHLSGRRKSMYKTNHEELMLVEARCQDLLRYLKDFYGDLEDMKIPNKEKCFDTVLSVIEIFQQLLLDNKKHRSEIADRQNLEED